MIKSTIYLDNNATTVIAPEVLDAMLPFFTKHYGNPSSGTHNFGLYAERIVEQQRKTLADIFHCHPNGIVFTSGATESINFVIKGLVEGLWPEKNKLITTTIEHPAVHESFKYLESKGVETAYIPVNREGVIDMNALALAMDDRTALVSVIAAHNEIGTLQECQLIAELCRERNIYSHFDFAQAGDSSKFY
ncbi:MAG: aminotransferase class V-fold PLP-dependent enzyme [Ignavibacteriales bacterium]|nr:aminotransferase class V-fold PLP-dependent enzyme [Ignavibacteriales bacterium]